MSVVRISALLLLSCVAASAQEGKMQVGRGVICHTPEQAKQFVALRSNGKEQDVALLTVNRDASDAAACNVGLFMFSVAEPVAEMALNGRPIAIIKITVHAFGIGSVWRQIPQSVQYTVVPEQGQMA